MSETNPHVCQPLRLESKAPPKNPGVKRNLSEDFDRVADPPGQLLWKTWMYMAGAIKFMIFYAASI
jgi:hypothetical protein